MSNVGVEELYKNYGILADAGEDISKVSGFKVAPRLERVWISIE